MRLWSLCRAYDELAVSLCTAGTNVARAIELVNDERT